MLVELQEAGGIITNGTAYYNAVCERETSGGSTAIGEGMALPMPATRVWRRRVSPALTLRRGINWGAADGDPVDLIFMIAVPPGAESLHLQILARLVNLLSDAELARMLRVSTSPEDFILRLTRAEASRFA